MAVRWRGRTLVTGAGDGRWLPACRPDLTGRWGWMWLSSRQAASPLSFAGPFPCSRGLLL